MVFNPDFPGLEQAMTRDEHRKKRIRPRKCVECGVNLADYPGKLCPGCYAYKEHCQ